MRYWIFLLFFLLWNLVNANKLDSLKSLLQQDISDSVRFEVYNQIFPIVVFQNVDSAYKYLKKQKQLLKIKKFDKETKSEFLIDIYNNSGIYYNKKGKNDSAIIFYERTLNIAKNNNKKRETAIALNNIANIHFLKGNYNISLDYHLKSLKIRKSIADTVGIAMSYGNIGLIYVSQKKYFKAIENYEKAKKYFELKNDRHAIAWVYRVIGVAYLNMEKHDKAEKNLQTSLQLCKKDGDTLGIKYCLLNLGITYMSKYNNTSNDVLLNTADTMFYEVCKLQEITKNKRIEINYNNYKSKLLIYKKQYTEALKLLGKSEKHLKKINLKNELKDVYMFKSQAYEGLKAYKSALECYKDFKEISDTLFNIEKDKEIGRKEAWFEYEEKLKIAKLENENKINLERAQKKRMELWLIIIVLLSFLGGVIFIFIYRKLTKESRLVKQQKAQILRKYNDLEEAYNKALTNLEELKTLSENIKTNNKPLPDWVEKLSRREIEVLSCLAVGMSDKEISEKLFISLTTTRTHCRRIYSKLLVKNRSEAVNISREYGII